MSHNNTVAWWDRFYCAHMHFVVDFIFKLHCYWSIYLPPANQVCEGYVLQVSVCPQGGAWLLLGGHAWLLWGGCVVAPGGHACCSGGGVWLLQGGHAWLLQGGHAWLLPGGCVVAPGGVHGFLRGRAWFFDEMRSMSGRYASYWNAFLF